jgi:hypothetical protein
MLPELPNPIQAYFAAANAHDIDACTACFAADASVRDEGREWVGVAGLRTWIGEVNAKYAPIVNVVDIDEVDDRTIVTARVSGSFPGSPIELRYAFTLNGDKIERLEIHS